MPTIPKSKMTEGAVTMLWVAPLLLNIILVVVLINQAKQIEFMRIAVSKYAVEHGVSLARKKLKETPQIYKNVADRHYVNYKNINVMNMQENGMITNEFGAKGMPHWAAMKLPPNQWQPEAATMIYIQEMEDFIFTRLQGESRGDWLDRVKRYYRHLAKRYCFIDREKWARSCYFFWCEQNNIDVNKEKRK